jgi:imidazoleglycerol-phosphate dehydratase
MAMKRKTVSDSDRFAEVKRKTRETDIEVRFRIDGSGRTSIDTGIPFMDHMLELFGRHGCFDLEICAKGDLQIDAHHTMEDLGLTLGEAIARALGDKAGIRRYGWALLPMDEALAMVSLDLSGRPCLVYRLEPPAARIRELDTALFREFFQALAVKAGMNLHIRLVEGEEVHHVFEAVFKGFAKALDMASSLDPRIVGVPSTKGTLA